MTNKPRKSSGSTDALTAGACLLIVTGCAMSGLLGSWLPILGTILATVTAQTAVYALCSEVKKDA